MPDSYWIASAPGAELPAAEGGFHVDVAIVGGGMVGITAAYLLGKTGLSVALLEARRIARQVTGCTTAKVTSLHGLIYAEFAERHDRDTARLYGESQQAALRLMRELVAEHSIDCDLETVPAYTYCTDAANIEKVRDEAETAAELGLPADFVEGAATPFPAAGAVRFRDQAQFHPRKYLLELARLAQETGVSIYENSRTLDISDGKPCRIETERGEITADSVIVATHMPILDRAGYFSIAYPFAHVALSGRLAEPTGLDGMYISVEGPTRSVRTHGKGEVLIATGGEFKAGKSDGHDEMAALEDWVLRNFPGVTVEHRWSNHDLKTADRLPLIGRLTSRSDHVFVATGFAAWGMTGGTLAAMILSDAVQGRENPWAGIYDSTRSGVRTGIGTFVKENMDVAKTWAGDHLVSGRKADPEALAAGEAAIFSGRIAAHRDAGGRLHKCSAVCTHMGCTVAWNEVDSTWDCPCHGSRFEPDGGVLFGPAVAPLVPADGAR